MAALAICIVTAALLKDRAGSQAPPSVRPGHLPPADPCTIPLTIPEVRGLIAAITRPHHLVVRLDRRHQARANWHHQRTRLERD
jgi:hypothetical protein